MHLELKVLKFWVNNAVGLAVSSGLLAVSAFSGMHLQLLLALN
jgi:hypothetical protein